MIRLLTCALGLCAALTSCAKLGKDPKTEPPNPFGPTGVPPHLRAGNGGSNAVTPGGNVKMGPIAAAITPEEDIVFTDPDNPDASLPELATLLTPAKNRGPWESSDTIARRRASREGKPLLIWFTDSQSSPMCKALNEELFNKSEFEQWAGEKLVRLRIDANERAAASDPDLSLDEKMTKETDVRNYVINLKKRYKVLGHPTLILLNPGGEVVGRYRGYRRGDADFTWGLIKQGEIAAMTAYRGWREDLEKKGYREWQDTKGRKVFAKLLNYHQGELVLMEPDGTRSKTKEARLSDADRSWIGQQKAKRGIQ